MAADLRAGDFTETKGAMGKAEERSFAGWTNSQEVRLLFAQWAARC